jgi:predicted enzyme related to lactoylglutathione lyase
MSARLVHLELHTGDLRVAGAFYEGLLDWRSEPVETRAGSYVALAIGDGVDGGIVECDSPRPVWLPYAEVVDVYAATQRARRLGGSVLLGPRECLTGWRSVVAAPDGGEIALWQPKDRT